MGRIEAGNGATRKLDFQWWPDLQEITPPDYLVKGVLERGTMAVLYGPPSCGKSFLAMDMGIHIALGWEWQGHRVKQCTVAYVGAEGGDGIRRRLKAFSLHHKIDSDDIPFALYPRPLDLFDPDADIDSLIAAVQAMPGAGLVVIDTVARCMGAGDENFARDINQFVKNIDRLREQTGCAVVVIHHTGKDESRGSRGSIALPAAVDTEVSISKADSVSSVTVKKQRDGETGDLFSFTLKSVEIAIDQDGEPVRSCVVEVAEAPAKPKGNGLSNNQRNAHMALSDLVVRAGQKPTFGLGHVPHDALVVHKDTFKACLLKNGVISSTIKNDRDAYKKICDGLVAKKVIGRYDDHVWLA